MTTNLTYKVVLDQNSVMVGSFVYSSFDENKIDLNRSLIDFENELKSDEMKDFIVLNRIPMILQAKEKNENLSLEEIVADMNTRNDIFSLAINDDPNLNGTYYKVVWNTEKYKILNWSPGSTRNDPAYGYTYDEEKNAFIPPCLNEGYILNENTFEWEPDLEKTYDLHGDGKHYAYNPEDKSWSPTW